MNGVLDFSRSFMTFFASSKQDENIARIQFDAICTVDGWGPDGGRKRDIPPHRALPQRTNVSPRGSFFRFRTMSFAAFSRADRVSLVRTHWTSDREAAECTRTPEDRFEGAIDYTILPAERLSARFEAAIVDATLANRLLVARTEMNDEATGATAPSSNIPSRR